MERQARYQLRQPNDSENAKPIFIDLAAVREEQRQYGRKGDHEQPPPSYASLHRIERPSPQGFPPYSSDTDVDRSRSDEKQKPEVTDRRNSIPRKTTMKTKKSSRCCHRRRNRTSSISNGSCDCCFCYCCCISNSGDQQTGTTDSNYDSQNCCECDDCCQCDCDSCGDCGNCDNCDCGGCGDCGSCDCGSCDCGGCTIS